MLMALRCALRALFRGRSAAVPALAMLAAGAAAFFVAFTVLYGTFLRPLRYPAPSRLVVLSLRRPGGKVQPAALPWGTLRFWEHNRQPFAAIAAMEGIDVNLRGGPAVHVQALSCSAGYFRVFGVAPELGRGFGPGGAVQEAVLSDSLWRNRFGASSTVLGDRISINGAPAVVVGVMPAWFQPEMSAALWVSAPSMQRLSGGWNATIVARLRRGWTLPAASAYVRAAGRHLLAGIAGGLKPSFRRGMALGCVLYSSVLPQVPLSPLLMLLAAAVFVLLLACYNSGTLMAVHAEARGGEFWTRAALGAGRGSIAAQIICESLILVISATVLGMLLGNVALRLLSRAVPAGLLAPGALEMPSRWTAFAAAWIAAGCAAFVGGLAVYKGMPPSTAAAPLGPGISARGTAPRVRASAAMIAVQVAVAVALLVIVLLLGRSLSGLVRRGVGFDTRGILAIQAWDADGPYHSQAAVAAAYGSVLSRLRSLPDVRAVGVLGAGPPVGRGGETSVRVPGGELLGAEVREISPGALDLLGIARLRGRAVGPADVAGAPLVAVVNRAFAHRWFGGADPVGRRVLVPDIYGDRSAVIIIGEVADTRTAPEASSFGTVYLPLAQVPLPVHWQFQGWFPLTILVRGSHPMGLALAAERAASLAAPGLILGATETVRAMLWDLLAPWELVLVLVGALGALALMLAAGGIAATVAYEVGVRRREIAIRMALGASEATIFRCVLGPVASSAALGGVAGLGLAALLAPAVASLLYRVASTDIISLSGALALGLATAAVAAWLPARAAMNVDPARCLRAD